MLAVPGQALIRAEIAAAMRDDPAERIDVVEAVRRADRCPMGVVEIRRLGSGDVVAEESPVEIEVEFCAGGWRRRVGCCWRGRKRGVARSEEDGQSGGRDCGCAEEFAAGWT